METFVPALLPSVLQGKYLTYKEWKQDPFLKTAKDLSPTVCKYLTYKEWKHKHKLTRQ